MHGRLLFAFLFFFAAWPAFAQQASLAGQQQNLTSQDKDWLKYAVEDNHAEIETCLLAENRAISLAVKAFTRLMVDDHVQIASRLAALLNEENFEAPNGIGKEGHDTMSKLEALHGSQFDHEFMQHQIKDHEHDLQKFKDIEAETKIPRIRQYAAETYPILHQHLELAKAVEASLSESNRRASR
jgi:putative membrane protein